MYLIIGADLVPTESNIDLFRSGDRKSLTGEELGKVLEDADCRIFNLEVPLTDEEKPIEKKGPNLIAPTGAVEGYKALGVNLLTIANNHIMDQSGQGLKSTLDVLNGAGISHVGAGKDLNEASKPYIFTFAGRKIGVYACAEHEFSIATKDSPGANPFDPLNSLDHVEDLKSRVDYVIVLYHGGKEHYRYPSPLLQKVCRRLVDKGADLVVCQHSHCIGCDEKYRDGTIVYGQGNFLFDYNEDECWQTGLLVTVDNELCISYIPIVKNGNCVRLANHDAKDRILRAFCDRGKMIRKEGFVEESYRSFAIEYRHNYLRALGGRENILFRALNKISGNRLRMKLFYKRYGKNEFLAIRNYVECEAHRELLLEGVECD